jgi:hypothetical protein
MRAAKSVRAGTATTARDPRRFNQPGRRIESAFNQSPSSLQAREPLTAAAVFHARAEARALLWYAGEYTLHEAVDVLQADALKSGLVAKLGQDRVQAILAAAFDTIPREVL